MRPRTVRPEVYAIQSRFFEALDRLMEIGRIESLTSFCDRYGLHRPKYSSIRTNIRKSHNPESGYKYIDIDALKYLARDYDVSSGWLLLGEGGMFENRA